MSAVGHGLVPGGGCWGQVAEGPSPIPRSDAPPSPCRGLHQAQRKRILITFQRKQQLEKITASRLPASASVSQDERVPRLLVLLGGPPSLLSPSGHPFLQRGAARCHLPCHRGVPCALPVPSATIPVPWRDGGAPGALAERGGSPTVAFPGCLSLRPWKGLMEMEIAVSVVPGSVSLLSPSV